MDAAPFQPVNQPLASETLQGLVALDPALIEELWINSEARSWGLNRKEFERCIQLIAMRQNFGLPPASTATEAEKAAFFSGLRLGDLVLATACAEGSDCAWKHFIYVFEQSLTRAAIAISGSKTVGHDLADAFYAELYGLNTRDGKRKCPLESYRGRGSLIGWLRTTLAQRFVDHFRRTYREEELDEQRYDAQISEESVPAEPDVVSKLSRAVQGALGEEPGENRFVLASYYLDGKTLSEIGKLLGVHEATVSRRLKRSTETMRKRILKNLEKSGFTRRAAEEALGTDPRDVDLKIDLKKLLQHPESKTFPQQATADAVLVQTLTTASETDRTKIEE